MNKSHITATNDSYYERVRACSPQRPAGLAIRRASYPRRRSLGTWGMVSGMPSTAVGNMGGATVSIIPGGSGAAGPDEPSYLLVIAEGSSSAFPLPAQSPVIIGRGAEADLGIPHASVSRRHARLSIQNAEYVIEDLGSHNCTKVNGQRIDRQSVLRAGDVIAIGEALLILHLSAVAPPLRVLLDARALRQRLSEERERSVRYQRPFAVLSIDVGVPQWDRDSVVVRLQPKLRLMDALGVIGDSLLCAVLPELDEDEVLELGKAIISELCPEYPRVRCGYSRCPADGQDIDTLLILSRRAAEASPVKGVSGAATLSVVRQYGERTVLLADPAMLRLYDLLERLGPSTMPVLISGETGCGKELAAAALHHHSPRRSKRLLAINCAALPDALAESELFGHERGAFSGAVQSKIGLLESAQGGTVFLDEVGELSPAIQAKLLRALETQLILRVGDTRERPIDIRLVAATHRNLEAEALAGRFRQDLYFRLGAAVVSLPPLRHRKIEIPMLARSFLDAARRRLGKTPLVISDQVMERLLGYRWPGNVRELKNDMDFLATTVTEGAVEPWHLPAKFADNILTDEGGAKAAASGESSALSSTAEPPLSPARQPPQRPKSFVPLEQELRELERTRMREALEATRGIQSQAAELLSMPKRTFFAKMKQYGMSRQPTLLELGSGRVFSAAD